MKQPLEWVPRLWRGNVMAIYRLEKVTGWTPELSPPPDSPLYRWRVLAGDVQPWPRTVALSVPESRHSGTRKARTRNREVPG